MTDTSLSMVELFTDFKYNGVSKLDLGGDLMIDLIVDFLATIGDIIADIWVNKIVTKFKKKIDPHRNKEKLARRGYYGISEAYKSMHSI